MKVSVALSFVILIVLKYASSQTSKCRIYDCTNDVANGGEGISRVCADSKEDNIVHIEACKSKENDYYCPVSLTNIKNVTCAQEQYPPWERDLAPGDICTESAQCFKNNLCVDGVCQGKPGKSACTYDKECDVGAHCMNRICTPVIDEGEECHESKGEECAFGLMCHENVCTQLGALTNQDQVASKEYEQLCSTFYATNAYEDRNKILCGYAPKLLSEEFKRVDPSDLSCAYKAYYPDTGKDYILTNYAKCGYNKDEDHYCPKFVGEDEFVKKAKDYRRMWALHLNCHTESTKVYCKDTIDLGFQPLMAQWETDMLETETEESYALVANNKECLRKVLNRKYWRFDEEEDTAIWHVSTITLMLGILIYFN